MAIIKLYGWELSPTTRRVIAALKEKEVPYEMVTVDLRKGENKEVDYLNRDPFGLIPTLEDGDIRIFESRAIARYVATKYANQGTDLLGSTPGERAAVDQWLEVEGQNYQVATAGVLRELLFKRVLFGLGPDEKDLAKGREALTKVLDIYEGRLAQVPYLAGDFFSLADLSHLPNAQLLFEIGEGDYFTSRPHLNAWWERISSRPAWQAITAAGSLLDPKE